MEKSESLDIKQLISNEKYIIYIHSETDSEVNCIIYLNEPIMRNVYPDRTTLSFNITELPSIINALFLAKQQFLIDEYPSSRQPIYILDDIFVYPNKEGEVNELFLSKDNKGIDVIKDDIDSLINDLKGINHVVTESVNKILFNQYNILKKYML